MVTLTEAEVNSVLERFDQTDPAIQRETIVELLNKLANAQEFKRYVHQRLDGMGIPDDPDPTRTEETGCRIGSRLNHVKKCVDEIESIRDDMWIAIDESQWSEETKAVVEQYSKRMEAAIQLMPF